MGILEETNACLAPISFTIAWVENDYDHGKIRYTHGTFEGKTNGQDDYGNPSRMDLHLTRWSLILPPAQFLISRTLQQRKEDLFDEYERFRAIGNESIHDYFVRFHKLVNDIIVDPLAYVAHTTSAPVLSSPSTPSPQLTAQSPNDALMATMTQIANLLSGFQKQFPPTNNQLRTSSNSGLMMRWHVGHLGEGHVARQCPEPRERWTLNTSKILSFTDEAKKKGDVLDVKLKDPR
ncbi:hypothetical protein Tco_0989600 [Tanacetum coccineum]|uniref:Retrotransposon gag domain-containing protein n=1 Tax=Tanacetum coccineum TaxID=301880 RepID=A0ABQ5EU42_9ASTR